MALYANRLQVPIKELSADWIPEEGELFQDSSDNLYMGDNVTASNALTPINGGGGGGDNTIEHDPFGYSDTTNPSGIGIDEVRFNSTTFGSITKMYVSDNDQNAVDLVAEQSIMTSGVAKLYKAEGGKLSFQVTRMVDQSGYFEYDVVPLSGTMPTVGEVCYVDFVPGVSLQQLRGPLITESGTTRTLALTDADKFILCTNSGAVSITVPPQSSVAWDDNTVICIEQDGTGQVTIVAGSGVTIQTSQTLKTAFRYAPVVLRRVGSDDWRLYGERELA